MHAAAWQWESHYKDIVGQLSSPGLYVQKEISSQLLTYVNSDSKISIKVSTKISYFENCNS